MPASRVVQECLRSYGYGRINRVMYGDDAPLFPIDTSQSFGMLSLQKLIAQLPKIDRQLETELKGMGKSSLFSHSLKNKLHFSAKFTATGDIDCVVMTELYLMCPDTMNSKKETDIVLVQEDNVTSCFDMWQQSVVFECHAFRVRISQTSQSSSKHFNLEIFLYPMSSIT